MQGSVKGVPMAANCSEVYQNNYPTITAVFTNPSHTDMENFWGRNFQAVSPQIIDGFLRFFVSSGTYDTSSNTGAMIYLYLWPHQCNFIEGSIGRSIVEETWKFKVACTHSNIS
jgi:hypothetical protein